MMAVSRIRIPADAKRDAAAVELTKVAHTWDVITLKQPYGSFERGDQFFGVWGSKGEYYRVNAVVCECVDYERGNICKHIRAVAILDEQRLTQSRPTYEDLYPSCIQKDCEEEREPRENFCWRHILVDAF